VPHVSGLKKAEADLSFEAYKPGQAKTTRTLVLLTGWFLAAWGSTSLMLALPLIWSKLGYAWNQFTWAGGASPDEAWMLDLVVVTQRFGPAFTISLVALAATALWFWSFLNTPKWADLLIEMEAELHKVSWPSFSDAWQSTLIVSAFTVTLVGTILVYDLIIRGIMELFSGIA